MVAETTWGGITYHNNDPMNLTHKRNIRNAVKHAYNCGGYALGTYSWYVPCSEELRTYLIKNKSMKSIATFFGPHGAKVIVKRTQEFVAYMLSEFSDLRVIESVDDLYEDEYAIAFRIGGGDYHFMRRGRNGVWYEKRGSSDYIDTVSAYKVFGESWHNRYNGPLVFMAKKLG